jgi:hypothetical protein
MRITSIAKWILDDKMGLKVLTVPLFFNHSYFAIFVRRQLSTREKIALGVSLSLQRSILCPNLR